jgi:uncharacterized protein
MPFRKFLLLALLFLACANNGGQERTLFVHDGEGVLAHDQVSRLDSLYRAHERSTGNEILLVTSADMNNEEQALHFAVDYWTRVGVGKKDRDNGVVIAFSKARREVFIATGYGTERVLHDSICQRIVDTGILPHFREDRTFDGLWAGSLAVVEFLERPENAIAPR